MLRWMGTVTLYEDVRLLKIVRGFCSIDREGSPIFGKVGTVGKSWYMYQLTMSKLR